MSVTIYDIAKAVGTSYGTVSRALNNHSRISEKTKQKVLKIATEMGYRPTHAARSLRRGRTNTIGLIIPDFLNPFYTDFIRAAELPCLDKHYRLMPVEYALNSNRQRACLEQMLEMRCDGVIAFFSTTEPFVDLLTEFWDKQIPCVMPFLQPSGNRVPIDGTVTDIGGVIGKTVEYLYHLGHRQIVLVSSMPSECVQTWQDYIDQQLTEDAKSNDRIGHFIKNMRRCGLELTRHHFLSSFVGDQLQDGMEAARQLLAKVPEATAVIAQNDLLATGMMRTFFDHEIRVPQDISVVGCDNTYLSRYSPIPLTSINLKTEQVAKAAVKIVFERLEEEMWGEPKHVFLDAELIIRQSTGLAHVAN